MQDMLHAFGIQAAHVVDLWRLMLAVCGAVALAVFAAVLIALRRAPRATERTDPDVAPLSRDEPRLRRAVGAAVGASAVLLVVLIVASVWTDRALARLPLQGAIHVVVTANQWWWDLRYDDPVPANVFHTANELHVPVGRPVILTLKSSDVIHSVWVPNLTGKKDLIPGRTATLQFRADRAGRYRGQCAEFCGHQHAHMALVVVAEPAERYDAWVARQRRAAAPPAEPERARGRDVFLGSTCVMCHAIAGTDAQGRTAPDLTHVGSRATLGAGTLANSGDGMAKWISDPHAFKPGVHMPPHRFADADLRALVAYLRGLE